MAQTDPTATDPTATAAGILDGIKVLDMTQYLAGPTVTRLMAEMGADIIKVEQAPGGDPSRHFAIVKDGRSGYYVQQNRGKKSLCIDFDTSGGREVLDQLIAECDVFVENYGPGVLAKRGLDWPTLSAKRPDLIMASISGFGRESSHADRPAFDMIAQAYSGVMFVTGEADGPPLPMGTSVADVMSGVHAATGIGFALFNRERTGRGQFIDIAMVDVLFHAHELGVQGPALTGGRWKPKRAGNLSSTASPVGAFKGPEGYIVIQCMQGQWQRFCDAMDRPDLFDDERFVDLRGRSKNRHELNAIVHDWLATFATDAEVIALLESRRVPCGPVLAPYDAADHPYFTSRGAVRVVPDPILGEVTIPGDPLRFSDRVEPLDLVAPTLGEHNGEILASLGYNPDAIAALEADGTLMSGPT